MPGSYYHMRRFEIQDYLDKCFPGAILIPRTPANQEAIILYPDGTVLARSTSNGRAIEDLTDPNRNLKRQLETLFDTQPYYKIDILNKRQVAANYTFHNLNELLLLSRVSGKQFDFSVDEDGLVKKIQLGDETFRIE